MPAEPNRANRLPQTWSTPVLTDRIRSAIVASKGEVKDRRLTPLLQPGLREKESALSLLNDRVFIVTGSGTGIGRAHAEYLARQGAKVVVNDFGTDVTGLGRDSQRAETVVEAILEQGGTAVADLHDVVTDSDKIVATALETYGRIDGIVNNAGITTNVAVEKVTFGEVIRAFNIHVLGTFGVIQAAWPHLRQQGFGRIVNTSSAAIFGVGGAPSYPMAKGAIIGLTKALAIDGAPYDIKVNAILPLGYSRMAETQPGLAEFMKKWYPPEAISPLVGALLSESAPVTGEAFAVGGGRAARVFLGTVPGLVGFSSAEDCLANFDRIMSMDGSTVPSSMEAEIGFEMAQIGADLSSITADLSALGADEK